jgi:hypothetical protein
MLVVEGRRIGGSERVRTGCLNQTTCVAPGIEKKGQHTIATLVPSGTTEKYAVRGETRREIRPAPPFVSGKFLNIVPAFRRKQDIWQAIRDVKCRKNITISQKMHEKRQFL